jgi:hypothetical protein
MLEVSFILSFAQYIFASEQSCQDNWSSYHEFCEDKSFRSCDFGQHVLNIHITWSFVVTCSSHIMTTSWLKLRHTSTVMKCVFSLLFFFVYTNILSSLFPLRLTVPQST